MAAGIAAALALAVSFPGAASAADNWTFQPVPVPAGTGAGFLFTVSCPSASFCAATGLTISDRNVTNPLVEFWNGSTWAVQSTPLSGAAHTQTGGVSCFSAADCMVVGTHTKRNGAGVPVAEHWDGSTWTQGSVPVPRGATSGALNGVSCAAANDCIAVGSSHLTSGQVALAEYWDGTTWAPTKTRVPAGAVSAGFEAVSCSHPFHCMAVGTAGNGTLAEHWNGHRWRITTTVTPPGKFSDLSAVSCRYDRICVAVGTTVLGPSFRTAALVEAYNGNTWALQTPATLNGEPAHLSGVSCVNRLNCTAVGRFNNGRGLPLAEHWNGKRWQQEQTARPAANVELDGISCIAGGFCAAVGNGLMQVGTGRFLLPIAESKNG